MSEKVELRKIDWADVKMGNDLTNLTVVKVGTPEECARWARQQGYRWVEDPKQLFGGKFVSRDGNNLIFT